MPTRLLHDSILTSKSLAAVSFEAEAVFPRLIVAVDDFGCGDADPAILRGKVWPRRECLGASLFARWLLELALAADPMVRIWRDGPDWYFFLVGWTGKRGQKAREEYHWQKNPHGSKRKTPAPPADQSQADLEAYAAEFLQAPEAAAILGHALRDPARPCSTQSDTADLRAPQSQSQSQSQDQNLPSAEPPAPKPAGKPKREKPPPDPRHAPFKAHFLARWRAAYSADFYWTARDGKDANAVLALGDNAEIRRRLDIALADPFFRKRGRVGQLADGWNGYAQPTPAKAAGPPEQTPEYHNRVWDPEQHKLVSRS